MALPRTGRQLAVTTFRQDPLVAVASPGHRWPGPGALTPAELARVPLILYERGGTIRRVVEGWFRRGGARPHVVMELGSEEAIKKLVEAGLGVSVTPVEVAELMATDPAALTRPGAAARAGAAARQAGDAGPARVPRRGGGPQ